MLITGAVGFFSICSNRFISIFSLKTDIKTGVFSVLYPAFVQTNTWGPFIKVKSTLFDLVLKVMRRSDNHKKIKVMKKYNAINNAYNIKMSLLSSSNKQESN